MFESQGMWFKSKDDKMEIYDDNILYMQGVRKNGLYVLAGNPMLGYVSSVMHDIDNTNLWNKRLGHVVQKGLLELLRKNLLCGDKVNKLEFYDICILGKAKRVSFNTGMHSTKKPFEYVHYNLWGMLGHKHMVGVNISCL